LIASSDFSESAGAIDVPFCVGDPRFLDRDLAAIATERGAATAWGAAFARYGTSAPTRVAGAFAVAIREGGDKTFLAVDRFAIRTMCYRWNGAALEFAERADRIDPAADLEPQSLFDLLYLHCIPAPCTVFRGVQRVPAGHYVLASAGDVAVARWWKPEFIEQAQPPYARLRDEFRHLLRAVIERQADGSQLGCYLSGGTDSSTVAGMLGAVTGRPARAFSIGFDAEGYDEMEYARIAARHFGAEHHEHYLTPAELVASIPLVAAHYDQPFGNSSALPAFRCAQLAREHGVKRVLAGDGGDELFGGNSRYARQRVFGWYDAIPGAIRSSLIEPAFSATAPLSRAPLTRKIGRYVNQAKVPMPDRLQTYNLLMRLGIHDVLTPVMRERVDPDAQLRTQREVWGQTLSRSLINRMLAYDWRYTLAENDLPKVVGTASLAGIDVGFPLLDDELVDFSLRLAPSYKLRGLRLRWFFKEALRDFLPRETIAKKKHGFGLPFGVWISNYAPLHALALTSARDLADRQIVRHDFVDRLFSRYLPDHPGYYGEMAWQLMMLEQWLRQHRPAFRMG
jgi:asparagine synthase (glutamine-hydrolysing)